ncbi:hypothetical protein, conserved [Eimeria praecox]|uniref:Transmembrane protein n=1 Tax=Eimeria praecox TaxID=51316 RepID=U6H9T1_9EIME|nr:hypothetical protein, conserved [Eimeria praecox]
MLVKMLEERAFTGGITTPFNSHKSGSSSSQQSNTVGPSPRFRIHTRSGARHSLLLKFAFVAASLTAAFLLVRCARLFAALRESGSRTRVLADKDSWLSGIGCAGGSEGSHESSTGTSSDDHSSDSPSTGGAWTPAALSGSPHDGPLGEPLEDVSEQGPRGSGILSPYPAPSSPLETDVPRDPSALRGPFHGTLFGEPVPPTSALEENGEYQPTSESSPAYISPSSLRGPSPSSSWRFWTSERPKHPNNREQSQEGQGASAALPDNPERSPTSFPTHAGSSMGALRGEQAEIPQSDQNGFHGYGPFGIVIGGHMHSPGARSTHLGIATNVGTAPAPSGPSSAHTPNLAPGFHEAP